MATKKNTDAATPAEAEAVINEELAHDSALEGLQMQAAALDAPPVPTPAEIKAETNTTSADLFSLLQAVRGMAQPAVWWQDEATFMQLWGDSTMKAVAEPLAEIMHRHGLTMGDMMGKYAPYIALGAALAPPTMATVQGYKLAVAQRAQPQPVTGGADA